MAESFSVKALLSAQDKGFTSTFKKASSAIDRIDSKISGMSFGFLSGVGQSAFNALSSGVSNLVNEIDSSNASWKTFESNLNMLDGWDATSIGAAKKELQDFAQKTVYSSSDMATTFAQLAAVGVKDTATLVKGFGGLAAAAENPQQAMKTLSQQATQMAAKPTVAWADFKLMLEQTPAGMAAVAKAMGMTTAELVTAVQDGEVSTEEFFNTIAEVGGSANSEFQKLATEPKTVSQAMDGLKETIGNKLIPAWELLTQKGIKAIDSIAESLAGVKAEDLANKVGAAVDMIGKYWGGLKDAFSGVGSALMDAFSAVKSSFEELTGAFGSTESVGNFKDMMQGVANFIKGIAGFIEKHADAIAALIANLPKILIAIKGFKICSTVAPLVVAFGKGLGGLVSKLGGGIAGKLKGVSDAQEALGESSVTSSGSILTSAKAFALMGAAVLMVAAGFALLAFSAISLANAGWPAIAVMAGLVLGLAALGFGMAALLKFLAPMSAQLMPAATAMLLMGAAVVLVAAGFAIMAFAAIQLANAGGLAIGIMVGLVAAMALLAIGAAALAPALTAGAVGLIAFGAAIVLVGVGAVLAAAAIAIIAAVLPTLAAYGLQGATAITALGASMIVFAAGAGSAGTAALIAGADMIAFGAGMTVGAAGALLMVAALKAVQSSMKSIASSAKTAQKSLGAVIAIFNGGSDGAYAAGAFIGMGFAQGMLSMLDTIRSAAAQMAAAADAAVRAKAQIHSPSKASAALGEYWGIGFADGIADTKRDVWNAAAGIVAIPNVATPKLSGSYSGEMSADFDYFRNAEYIIEVPLNVDGRAFARATAGYTQNELDRRQTRDNRNHGRV